MSIRLTIIESISLFLDFIEQIFCYVVSFLLRFRPLPKVKPLHSAIVITGTSAGIGRYMTFHFAKAGYTVFATVRKQSDAESLKQEWKSFRCFTGEVIPVIMDVVNAEQRKEAVEFIKHTLDEKALHLHALINNAGLIELIVTLAASQKHTDDIWQTNYFSVLSFIRELRPLLAKKAGGRIVNIGSLSGIVPLPTGAAYSGSKAALRSLSKILSQELRIYKISVSHVEPGFIETRGFTAAKVYQTLVERSGVSIFTKDDINTEDYINLNRLGKRLHDSMNKVTFLSVSERAVYLPVKHAVESARPLLNYFPGLDAKLVRMSHHIFGDNLIGLTNLAM